MFIANVLTQSENLTKKEYNWAASDSDIQNFDNKELNYEEIVGKNNKDKRRC